MQTAAAIDPSSKCCAHCGLPIPSSSPSNSAEIYCCHACRLVARIIGRQRDGEHTWNLLRLGFGALLSMNIMMLSLLLYTGSIETQTVPTFRMALLALSAPTLAILLPPFLSGALRELRLKNLSLDALIACGSLSAFIVSALHVTRGSGEIYFDTATMLPVLVTVGKVIEASAKTHAASLLHSLEALLPSTALRLVSGEAEEVPIDRLRPGDLVRVRPGERLAVDGEIVEGTSTIEEAAFSGEFLPRSSRPGDRVIAGTVNGAGSLVVRAEGTGEELLLHGILRMISDAWRNPSRAERIAERAASVFIPAVLFIAGGSILCWSLLGNLGQGLLSALSVLVVACPCTMGIATPLATSLAIARAAKAGAIVRGGSVMEQLAGAEIIFFDKTGTLTTGVPIVREIELYDDKVQEDEILGRLAALELGSEHLLGKAVVAKATACGIDRGAASQVQVVPGSGITGMVTWRDVTRAVTAGSEEFVGRAGKAPADCCTAVAVAWDGELRGRILLSDAIRPDAATTIEGLSRQGVASFLLSGDRFSAAASVAKAVGIDEICAPRTPRQKLEAVTAAVAAGRQVAMVGDGINDAPALAAAQTGIALGAGMDLAKLAGNVVLLSGRLPQIPWLISLSRRTAGIIRGNFAWSFGYNSVALAAAAAGLLHPLLAALLMVASSLTVLGNSLRITRFSDREAR